MDAIVFNVWIILFMVYIVAIIIMLVKHTYSENKSMKRWQRIEDVLTHRIGFEELQKNG